MKEPKNKKKSEVSSLCYVAESHDMNDNCGRIQLRLQKAKGRNPI
jgi:hypothetical protein